jgi:hypothetical protein
MRVLVPALFLCSCVAGAHADTFVKKNFGFAGDRELTLVGPPGDRQALRLELQKLGFRVLEVDQLPDATTRYAADIAGVCNFGLVALSGTDAELHVFVVKMENRERVLSVRLANRDSCPDAFFTEAATAIARYWPEQLAAQ